MTDTSSDESAYAVPEALGYLTNAIPALKRWAFLFRPTRRDWSAPQLQTRHRPGLERVAATGLPSRARAADDEPASCPRLGRVIRKPTVSTVGDSINRKPESPGDDTRRVTEILSRRRAITGDTALRLAHFFGTSPEFRLNLQSLYEIRLAQQKSGKSIKALPTLGRAHLVRA